MVLGGGMRSKTGKRRQMLMITALIVLVFLVIVLESAEGRAMNKRPQPQRRAKKSRAGVGRDFSEFLFIMGSIMTCVITPVLVSFVHSLYKDPASPQLARAMWETIKSKVLSYLGHQQQHSPSTFTFDRLGAVLDPSASRLRREDGNGNDNSDERFQANFSRSSTRTEFTATDRLHSVRPNKRIFGAFSEEEPLDDHGEDDIRHRYYKDRRGGGGRGRLTLSSSEDDGGSSSRMWSTQQGSLDEGIVGDVPPHKMPLIMRNGDYYDGGDELEWSTVGPVRRAADCLRTEDHVYSDNNNNGSGKTQEAERQVELGEAFYRERVRSRQNIATAFNARYTGGII